MEYDRNCQVHGPGLGRAEIGREEEKDMSLATHKILLAGTYDLNARNQVHVGSLVYNVLKCRNWNSIGHHTTIECVIETS